MLRIAVLVSGGGTNLQAIIDAIAAGKITDTEIAAVISNNKNAYALERAKQAGIKDIVVSPKDFETREVFNENLLKTLQEVNPDLIVLAGYLVVIPESVIDAFENRIINIHPSLIPAFCGTGYYVFVNALNLLCQMKHSLVYLNILNIPGPSQSHGLCSNPNFS